MFTSVQKITAACLALLLVATVQAGKVYDRSSGSIAAGVTTITPSARYAGLELKKAWVEGVTATNVAATVYRVIESGTVTQSVATVACGAATSGSGVPSHYAGIKAGEYWRITSTLGGTNVTSGTIYLDYEVQTHD